MDSDSYLGALAHLFGIREWEIPGLTVKAFHLYCDWIDAHNKAAAKGGR